MVGAPNFLSITTFLPFGPNVTFTALASLSTPSFNPALASVPNSTIFAAIFTSLFININYDKIPKISLSRIIKYSSPSTLTSVPEYLP